MAYNEERMMKMKNFIFGVLATIGALMVGNKLYDKGYDDAEAKLKKDGKSSDKDKKAK